MIYARSFIPHILLSVQLLVLQVEAFAEALHTTSGVENALLSGKEWVTT